MTDGWQPRWPGDLGDPFEPYLVSFSDGTALLRNLCQSDVLTFNYLSLNLKVVT